MSTVITINGREIGSKRPTYIIAEMSANHNKDYGAALEILHAAKDAGADAVKLQTYTADTLTIKCDSQHFRVADKSLWAGRILYDLYQEAFTPWEWQPKLMDEAKGIGLDLFSTPFDSTAVEFLEAMDVPAYKIASFEIVDIPLIERVAATGKPVIMSTGMASLGEIEEAVTAFRRAGGRELGLLKCTSAYPAPTEEMNLSTMRHLSAAFNVPVGLSDHSLSPAVPPVAVALGACIIEKHFTLSRAQHGPDSAFSLEPKEFSAMVAGVRDAEKATGEVKYGTGISDAPNATFRKSLFVVRDIHAGEELTPENVRCIRPGFGLKPKHYADVIGKKASMDIVRGTPLNWAHIANTLKKV